MNLKSVLLDTRQYFRDQKERVKKNYRKRYIASLKPLSEDQFIDVLVNRLLIQNGDFLFVHSSMNMLKTDFSPYYALKLLRRIVGENGLLVFPSYPQISAAKFIQSKKPFNIKKTGTESGLLAELARRSPGFIRSFHPTKSVCASGRLANELVKDHEKCPFPFDADSPYGKFVNLNGKIIGLGIPSYESISILHCVEDFMKTDFPSIKNHEAVSYVKCVDYNGDQRLIPIYLNLPLPGKPIYKKYIKKFFSSDICHDFMYEGRPFYYCLSKPFVEKGIDLAKKGITWLPKACNKPEFR